jgi:hypothetical protein
MKYIKPFNESLQPDEVNELKEFCETSLAYLYDEGYNVSLSVRDQVKYPDKQHIIVSLGLPEENYVPLRPYAGYQKFYWDDVKDYFIPFLQMLVRRYELLPYRGDDYVYFNGEMGFDYFSIDEVISDKVSFMNHITGEYRNYNVKGSRLWGINIKILDKI